VIAQPYSTYFGEAWQVDYIIYDVLFGEALLSVRRVVEEVVECYMYSGEVLVTLTVKGATTLVKWSTMAHTVPELLHHTTRCFCATLASSNDDDLYFVIPTRNACNRSSEGL